MDSPAQCIVAVVVAAKAIAPHRRIEGGAERIRKATELERLATARADSKAMP